MRVGDDGKDLPCGLTAFAPPQTPYTRSLRGDSYRRAKAAFLSRLRPNGLSKPCSPPCALLASCLVAAYSFENNTTGCSAYCFTASVNVWDGGRVGVLVQLDCLVTPQYREEYLVCMHLPLGRRFLNKICPPKRGIPNIRAYFWAL